MNRKRKITIMILGVLFASILAILSKILWPNDVGTENFDSLAVKIFGFPAVASFYFLFIYSYNAAVLIRLGKASPLTNIQTGLRFGACFGAIYLFGMQEVVVEASPYTQWGIEYVIYQLVMGAGEALAALLLCLTLSKFFIQKKNNNVNIQKSGKKQQISTIILIACAFTLERAVAYETGFISSNVDTFPVPVYAWTVIFGIILGICFTTLIPVFSIIKAESMRCFKISVVTIGFSWMIFNSFIGFIFKGELLNLLIRSGLDVVTIFLAALLSRYIINRGQALT